MKTGLERIYGVGGMSEDHGVTKNSMLTENSEEDGGRDGGERAAEESTIAAATAMVDPPTTLHLKFDIRFFRSQLLTL